MYGMPLSVKACEGYLCHHVISVSTNLITSLALQHKLMKLMWACRPISHMHGHVRTMLTDCQTEFQGPAQLVAYIFKCLPASTTSIGVIPKKPWQP